jgi:hypothetical protein
MRRNPTTPPTKHPDYPFIFPKARVETHPATDAWMQGDRYGTVKAVRASDETALVSMQRSGRDRRFRLQDLITVV